MIRHGNSVRKAKRLATEGHLVVKSTEILDTFQVVQTGNEESSHFVDAKAQTCDCEAYVMTGKVCFHKVAVEIHQTGDIADSSIAPARGKRPYVAATRGIWANKKRGAKKKSNRIQLSDRLPVLQQRIQKKEAIRKNLANLSEQQKKRRKVENENLEISTNEAESMDVSVPNANQQQEKPKKRSLYHRMLVLQEKSKNSSESRTTRGVQKDYNLLKNHKLE